MSSSKNLQQAIADITIWRKGEQRAPHKPLLLLYVLAGYQQGHGRLFDYGSEVRDPLHSLLERFGPLRAQYRPDMPFWRLQGDGFWELQNAEHCSSKQPPAGELVTHNVAGGFDAQHLVLLKKSNNLINALAQQILEAHFTESIQEEIADELGFDILQIRKQRDPLFRQQVLRAYNYECATTVLRLPWKPPISNGNSTAGPARFQTAWRHHKAFDKGSIGLDESMRVLVSPAVNGSGMVGILFWDFDGKSIALPMMRGNYPKEGFVEWHRKEVFRG